MTEGRKDIKFFVVHVTLVVIVIALFSSVYYFRNLWVNNSEENTNDNLVNTKHTHQITISEAVEMFAKGKKEKAAKSTVTLLSGSNAQAHYKELENIISSENKARQIAAIELMAITGKPEYAGADDIAEVVPDPDRYSPDNPRDLSMRDGTKSMMYLLKMHLERNLWPVLTANPIFTTSPELGKEFIKDYRKSVVEKDDTPSPPAVY